MHNKQTLQERIKVHQYPDPLYRHQVDSRPAYYYDGSVVDPRWVSHEFGKLSGNIIIIKTLRTIAP